MLTYSGQFDKQEGKEGKMGTKTMNLKDEIHIAIEALQSNIGAKSKAETVELMLKILMPSAKKIALMNALELNVDLSALLFDTISKAISDAQFKQSFINNFATPVIQSKHYPSMLKEVFKSDNPPSTWAELLVELGEQADFQSDNIELHKYPVAQQRFYHQASWLRSQTNNSIDIDQNSGKLVKPRLTNW